MAYVQGLDQVLQRIDLEINRIRGRTLEGMMAAMEHLEDEMDSVSPTVPEDTKFMRESWYIFPVANHVNPIVMAGYSAQYAPYVHEKLDAINWTKAGSGAKWLEIHFARNKRAMQYIIAQHIKVGL